MNKFETYLINNGIHFQVAGTYGRVADKYIQWLKANNLKASQVKRSQFTDWIQQCREQGNGERTIRMKENIIKHYYHFLGTKNNPAKSWIKRKKEHKLPPAAIEKADLLKMYESYKPQSPAGYRSRCMLGMILFQGIKRSELAELRLSDLDIETGIVFVQGQRRSNSRRLKLEPCQMFHLNDYINRYRKDFLCYKKEETDRLFLSRGSGVGLENAISRLLYHLRKTFPQIENLLHLRGSVITHWQKQEGVMEAMQKAGHRYISSTQRYQTNKYEELQDQLRAKHPLEQLPI